MCRNFEMKSLSWQTLKNPGSYVRAITVLNFLIFLSSLMLLSYKTSFVSTSLDVLVNSEEATRSLVLCPVLGYYCVLLHTTTLLD